jgi:hypothetical protein
MLTYDEMPDDNADLAKVNVGFPHASSTEVADSNEIEPYLMDYLEQEGYKPDVALQFLRTALVAETVYWIWAFATDGEAAYAIATQDKDGQTSLGCDTNYYGLTPEQYVLADYHNCL